MCGYLRVFKVEVGHYKGNALATFCTLASHSLCIWLHQGVVYTHRCAPRGHLRVFQVETALGQCTCNFLHPRIPLALHTAPSGCDTHLEMCTACTPPHFRSISCAVQRPGLFCNSTGILLPSNPCIPLTLHTAPSGGGPHPQTCTAWYTSAFSK